MHNNVNYTATDTCRHPWNTQSTIHYTIPPFTQYTRPPPPPLPPTLQSPRTLGDLEIKKSPNLVETGQCPATPHQKFIFGNYNQNLLKSRYQSFLVLLLWAKYFLMIADSHSDFHLDPHSNFHLQSWAKYLKQSKEIKRNWR